MNPEDCSDRPPMYSFDRMHSAAEVIFSRDRRYLGSVKTECDSAIRRSIIGSPHFAI